MRTVLKQRLAIWLLLVALALPGATVEATSFVRMSFDDLTLANDVVVRGHAVDAVSRWTEDHALIVTDVRFRIGATVKGDPGSKEIVVTVLGGRVGDTSVVVINNARLAPGSEYLLFLARNDVPGGRVSFTVPDLAQGVGEVTRFKGPGGSLHVKSQAWSTTPEEVDELPAEPAGPVGERLKVLLKRLREVASNQKEEGGP